MESISLDAPIPRAARLLLVDDEPSILHALRRVFHSHGYEIQTAESGKEGLEFLETSPVDVVISDMRMPEMDGAQFLEQVFSRWPDTKRILLTGFADASATVAAINRGKIWRYIAKPWNEDELLTAVQQALAHRQLVADNARLSLLTKQQNDELKTLNSALEAKVAERTSQLQQALLDLRKTFVGSVNVFSRLIDLRGGKLGAHSRRVADHSRVMAKRMVDDENEVQNIVLAALLHDIGKIGLPDELFDQPYSHLSAEHRAEVMKHPIKGELLLMPVQQLKEVARLIRFHHEHFDGSGYPDKLAGLDIPLGSRIVSVASDYDQMLMGGKFARQLAAHEAIDFLVANRNKRYDPAVVDTFVTALNETAAHPVVEIPYRPDSLRAGMELARDLLHGDGFLLLAKGHILSRTEIDHLRRIEQSENRPIVLNIVNRPLDTASAHPTQ